MRAYGKNDSEADEGGVREMQDEIANIIGYHMAALVSRDNMPHMSGDPRNRIPAHLRRRFDEACQEAANRIVEALKEPEAPSHC